MPVKMRRNFSGDLSSHFAEDGTWRIRRRGPTEMQIIVGGADANSAQRCGTTLHELAIEWRAGGVMLIVTGTLCAASIEAHSAIVHEGVPTLYAALPLAQFDGRARRFWRRVFLLVRIPGGRRLLGMLARASRNKPR